MARRPTRYRLVDDCGDIPRGKVVYLSLYHQPVLDSHRMITILPCGKGPAYSVPDSSLEDYPYDEFDD